MDAVIIRDALKMYKDRGGHNEKELKAIDRLMKDAEDLRRLSIFNNDQPDGYVNFVPSGFMLDAMNMMTYDIFGKLARKYGPENVPMTDYMFEVHWYVHRCLIPTVITNAADFLKDLWSANEEAGCNREDGTFDR